MLATNKYIKIKNKTTPCVDKQTKRTTRLLASTVMSAMLLQGTMTESSVADGSQWYARSVLLLADSSARPVGSKQMARTRDASTSVLDTSANVSRSQNLTVLQPQAREGPGHQPAPKHTGRHCWSPGGSRTGESQAQ